MKYFDLSLVSLLYACDNHDQDKVQDTFPSPKIDNIATEPLSNERYIHRISIALLGRPAFVHEIDNWKEKEDQQIIAEILDQTEAYEQLTFLFEQWLLTRVEDFNLTYEDYHLEEALSYDFMYSIGQEAPRLMSYVATKDRPWTEIVTADYTLSNDILLDIWPLERLESQDSQDDNQNWFRAKYTDGRPAGGVLMTNGLWWRYYTTPNNNNRARAAALMNLFLCENLLLRPIRFQATALLEADEINNVIQTDAACVGCHNTLDPLASAFFGFWWFDIYDRRELSRYHPEREFLGEEINYLNTPMAYFGQPMYTPAELGTYVSMDPRFISCTVEKTAQLLWQRNISIEDHSKLTLFREDFLSSQLSYKHLLTTIMTDEIFKSAYVETEENRYLLQPHQLESTFYALTGFLWKDGSQSLLQSNTGGYRQILGGVDGREITQPVRSPTISRQLVIKRLAQNSAEHWVDSNWESIDERGYLFLDVPLENIETQEEQRDLFERWIHRSTSVEPSQIEIDELMDLFSKIEADYDRPTAYKTVISVILRSVDLWSY